MTTPPCEGFIIKNWRYAAVITGCRRAGGDAGMNTRRSRIFQAVRTRALVMHHLALQRATLRRISPARVAVRRSGAAEEPGYSSVGGGPAALVRAAPLPGRARHHRPTPASDGTTWRLTRGCLWCRPARTRPSASHARSQPCERSSRFGSAPC
jgi:hypothetical protein